MNLLLLRFARRPSRSGRGFPVGRVANLPTDGRRIATLPHACAKSGLVALLLSAALTIGFVAQADEAETARPAAPPKPIAPAATVLDDVPLPLVQQPRSEAEQDRVDALAMFAAGRMHERRGEDREALRRFERAFLYDPQATAIARAIVPVAVRLNRHAEAARYALKAADNEDTDPAILRRLAMHLTQEHQWKGAGQLFQRAFGAQTGKESAADIILRKNMGRLFYLADDYKQAADCLARVLYAIDHPKEFNLDDEAMRVLLEEAGPTYLWIGDCFVLADRPKEALDAFERADKIAPNKALMEFCRARVLAKTGKPDQSLAALEACFKEQLSSEGTAPYELLAEVLDKLGKKQELLPRLEKVYADDAGNLALGYFLAERYRQSKQFDKAEPLFRDLMQSTPTLAGYRSLIEIYGQTKQFERLLAVLGQTMENVGMLEAMGDHSQALAKNAEVLGGLVETARKLLKEAPEKADYGLRLAVAVLAMEAKQFDTATEFFESALKAKNAKAGELYLIWGVGLLIEERAAEATKVFRRGIDEKALSDKNPLFYFYLAGSLVLEDRIDDALAAAKMAVKAQPQSARYCSRVPWVLYRGKRYDDAVRAYRDFLEKFDKDYDSAETRQHLREARLMLSNVYVIEQQLSAAEECLAEVLDEFPDDTGAGNDLAYLWVDRSAHLSRALKMIQAAVAAEPENAAYRDSLGWAFYRLGRCAEAAAELEKAAAGRPDAVIFDHLGDTYLKLDKADKAQEAWRRAVEGYRKDKEPAKAQEVEKKLEAHK
jgi:tetratricopeptide (TPR) repeat protein